MSAIDEKLRTEPRTDSTPARATREQIEAMAGKLFVIGTTHLRLVCEPAGVDWTWRLIRGSGKSAMYEREP